MNADDFTAAALKGERLDRLTDRTGKRLTDGYLVDELSKVTPRFAWLKDVYVVHVRVHPHERESHVCDRGDGRRQHYDCGDRTIG